MLPQGGGTPAALFAALILWATPGYADENKVITDAVGGLFDGLKKDSAVRAAAAVEKHFRLSDDEQAELLGRLPVLLRKAGRLQRWKVVSTERMPGGDRWRTAVIVSHHERRPVAWAIQIYKVGGGAWSILEISFDAADPGSFIRARVAPSTP